MATTTITATDSPHQDPLSRAQWPDYDRAQRSRSTTSLPLSDAASEMTRRTSNSTVTKKTRIQKLRGSGRPSTAPGKTPPAPFNHDQAPPPPPPSAFSGKTGWLKRIASLRSSSTLALPDKEEDTLSVASHSVISKDGYDVDQFGTRGRAAESDDDFASTYTSPSKTNVSKSGFNHRAKRNSEGGGAGEGLYDFLQALEMAPPPGQAFPQPKPRPKGSAVKQAPPLIDLTGGMYMRRSVNRSSVVGPPSPIAPLVTSSSSTDSSATISSTLVDSPHRRSAASDSSSGSSGHGNDSSGAPPCAPSTPPPTLTDANIDDAEVKIKQGPTAVPVVLPITPKPKLTARKRAPSPPPLPTNRNRVPSSATSPPPPTSPLPRSVSSPAVPDPQRERQVEEEQRQRAALEELLKESLGQLRAPPKAFYSSTSDPGLCLTWTTRPKVVLRSLPSSPEMQNEMAAFPSSPSTAAQDLQPVGDQVPPSETPNVEAAVPLVPEAALPQAPERAFVKSPRRQPQTPTSPSPPSPNLHLQSLIPLLSSISFPSPPPSPPKAAASEIQSPPPSPPRPQTPPQRTLSASPSPTSTATEKPFPASPTPRAAAATLEPLTSPQTSDSGRAPRDRTSDSSALTDYEKTLAAISPEDIHISQRTLLEPVVRKASDVSLKQLFKELDLGSEVEGGGDSAPRMKKRSLNGLTGAVVGGVSASVGSVGKKSRKRPATAGAAVDLTKVNKTPLAIPVLSGTSTPINGTLGPADARAAAQSLANAVSSSSSSSSSRTPLSTRRPRTATEPHHQQQQQLRLGSAAEPSQQQRLGRALTTANHRANAGKSLNMDWDRQGNPWDDPTFRSEGSVFRDAPPAPSSSGVPRSRAKSEAAPAPPPVASALALSLAVKKEGKKLSLKRPSTADSTLRSLLKKKSSQALSVASKQQQHESAPPVPPTPTSASGTEPGPPSPPPSAYRSSFRRSLTIRSKSKGREKELPLPPPPPTADLEHNEAPAISTNPSPPSFESDGPLTMRDIYEASLIPVWDKDGHKVAFGKLFEDQVTIVIFIRHFWCPMCQDYMKSIVKELEPGRLAQSRVKLIVIGCGDPAMIKSYNDKIVKSPFEMYTDPKLILFAALGMTLKSTDGGPEERKGKYIKHGTFMGTLNVIGRAIMSMTPGVLVKKGGDIKQLGGEFILGPGLRCRFAHRMSTTRNHTAIREVVINAGVQLTPSSAHVRTPSEEEEWAARRKGLTKRKTIRKSIEDVLARPAKAHVSSAVCGDDDACGVRPNHLVGTI